MNMKFFVRDISGLLGILALSIVALGASAPSLYAQAPPPLPHRLPPTAADMKGKTAEQYYKKIEVLKGIPADQVHPAMEYITTALGVGCGYCHVIGHFDQDDKREKHVARSMIQMTMALNNTVFDGKREITCYTCHRGVAKAAATMLLANDKSPTEKSAMEVFPTLAIKNFLKHRRQHVAEQSARNRHERTRASACRAETSRCSASLRGGRFHASMKKLSAAKPQSIKLLRSHFKGTVDMMVPPPPGPPGTPPAPAAMGTVPGGTLT